jgi:hypothetical protein
MSSSSDLLRFWPKCSSESGQAGGTCICFKKEGEKMTADNTEWGELLAVWIQGGHSFIKTREDQSKRDRRGILMLGYAYPSRHTTEHACVWLVFLRPSIKKVEGAGIMINEFRFLYFCLLRVTWTESVALPVPVSACDIQEKYDY